MKKLILIMLGIVFLGGCVKKDKLSELDYNSLFCAEVGGKTEVIHHYENGGKKQTVIVDCETKYYVYESGKDKRSSLDSVQQVKFFSILTGKKPAIVIYDTDGKFGRYEYRIKQVADSLGIKFISKKVTDFKN